MVNVDKLSKICHICFDCEFTDIYKDFNKLRGAAFGRPALDCTYECMQIIEEYSNGKYPKDFLDRLVDIINS